MITDQDVVEFLGRKKEKENLEFQISLKNVKNVKIDIEPTLVELYRKVCEEIDCRTCASCCKKLRVTLSNDDIFKLKTVLVDCSLCPIVYNVFEELKKMLEFQSAMKQKQNAGVKIDI